MASCRARTHLDGLTPLRYRQGIRGSVRRRGIAQAGGLRQRLLEDERFFIGWEEHYFGHVGNLGQGRILSRNIGESAMYVCVYIFRPPLVLIG